MIKKTVTILLIVATLLCLSIPTVFASGESPDSFTADIPEIGTATYEFVGDPISSDVFGSLAYGIMPMTVTEAGIIEKHTNTLTEENDLDIIYWSQSETRTLKFGLTSTNASYNASVGLVGNDGYIYLLTDPSYSESTAAYSLSAVPSGYAYWCIVVLADTYDGNSYTLNMSRVLDAEISTVTASITNASTASYGYGTFPRINGNSTAIVEGTVKSGSVAVPYATVTVMIANPSWTAESQCYRYATVTADENGNYTAGIDVFHAVGEYSFLVGSATYFRHYFDLGIMQAYSGDVVSTPRDIYIFAYSIYVG